MHAGMAAEDASAASGDAMDAAAELRPNVSPPPPSLPLPPPPPSLPASSLSISEVEHLYAHRAADRRRRRTDAARPSLPLMHHIALLTHAPHKRAPRAGINPTLPPLPLPACAVRQVGDVALVEVAAVTPAGAYVRLLSPPYSRPGLLAAGNVSREPLDDGELLHLLHVGDTLKVWAGARAGLACASC